MSHEAGKGDKQRPTNYEAFARNFEAIFGGKTRVTEAEFNGADAAFEKEYNEHQKTNRAAGAVPQPGPHN